MALLSDTADRIDREPVLFLGCSNTEIMMLAGAGAAAGILLGILFSIVTGWWFTVMPLFFIGAFGGVWRGGKIMMKKKENKPEGYYSKLIMMNLSKTGIFNFFVHRAGYWRIYK